VDRPDVAHDAQVVAQQVGDHQVLRARLLVGAQLLGEAQILRVVARAAGALDRLGLESSGRGPRS